VLKNLDRRVKGLPQLLVRDLCCFKARAVAELTGNPALAPVVKAEAVDGCDGAAAAEVGPCVAACLGRLLSKSGCDCPCDAGLHLSVMRV
jgi:hypothetical protein